MANFQEIFTNFSIAALMVFALLSFTFIIQSENNAPKPLASDPLVNGTYVNLNTSLSDLETTSNTQYDAFSSETPATGLGAIVLFAIVSVGKNFGNIVFSIFALIIKIPLIVLGIEPTITSMIISVITIIVVIALWVVYKFGG